MPKSTLSTRLRAETACQTVGTNLPVIDFSRLQSDQLLLWDSSLNGTGSYRLQTQTYAASQPSTAVVLLNRYRIDVPSSIGAAYWFIEAVLGVDFVSGAQYGVMLRQANSSVVPLSLLADDLACLADQSCEVGAARFSSEKFLKVYLFYDCCCF